MSFPDAIDLRRVRMPRVSLPKPRVAIGGKMPSRLTLLIATLITFMVLVGGYMLLRNSSLVQVQQVKVVGLSGYYDKNARRAVIDEATQMTTLNFSTSRIADAAGQFVDVAAVHVNTNFPHGATITVDVRRPVLNAKVNGRTVTLSQNGQILVDAPGTSALPTLNTTGTISGDHVTAGKALSAARLLGAAPDVLLRKVQHLSFGKLGIVVTLDAGPALYFGDSSDASEKWRDAAAVLASSQAKGAAYIDLRTPGRPAVGGLGAAPATLTSQSGTTLATPGASTTDPASTTPTTTGQAPATTQTTPTQTQAQTQTQATPQTQTQPQTTTQTSPGAAGGASPTG